MFEQAISRYIEETRSILAGLSVSDIQKLIELLLGALQADRQVLIMGNGGSAATASHFVNDFNKGVSEKLGRRFRFICLNDNVSTLMAIANDIGFEQVFEFQLRNYLSPGDVVIGISGSGNSENVVRAMEYANTQGAHTVGLLGFDGGRLARIVKLPIIIRSDNMQHVEDLHLLLDHLVMSVIIASNGKGA